MQLIKFFIVFVTLFGRLCLSKIMIEINKPDEFEELQEAAIKTLTTCYADKDKTVLLIGNFPGNFVKKLSSHQSFSLVLVDSMRRAENNIDDPKQRDLNRMHKVHVVVIIAPFFVRFGPILTTNRLTPYYNPMASHLILGWSPENKYAACNGDFQTVQFLRIPNMYNLLNVILMCRHRTKRTVIFGSNPFINQAPEPWQLFRSINRRNGPSFSYFIREYWEHEGMCKNLDFDKTRDLGGSAIKIVTMQDYVTRIPAKKVYKAKRLSNVPKKKLRKYASRRQKLEMQMRSFWEIFITHMNGTKEELLVRVKVGDTVIAHMEHIQTRPTVITALASEGTLSYAYPYDVICTRAATQFRGYKSQLRKILSVIDMYSWIGMFMAYLITLIFFKYFLHQPLMEGILNLCRLTCNFGLTTLPTQVGSRIYLGCLLFFVITMQGIFVGNLAALLTHDIPVRQVNSMQDLADLGHKVYLESVDFKFFTDSVFKGRLILTLSDEKCLPYVIRDTLSSCLIHDGYAIDSALSSNLHVSTDCFRTEYITNILPFKWALEDNLNEFLGIMTSANTMGPLDAIVDKIRFIEEQSQPELNDPEIMTLRDLGFAFAILGIGLGCSLIAFVVEIIIYRFHRRVRTTRVIVLN